MTNKSVLVGLSGGVDSSVAAYLLKKQEYNVIGIYIRIFPDWLADFWRKKNGVLCPWALEQRSARKVAAELEIPFYTFDLSADYEKGVLKNFLAEYQRGRTPNPDVLCNQQIKFGSFLRIAEKVKADYVATGHYVRLRRKIQNPKSQSRNNEYHLLRGKDKTKDQSYFLWMLSLNQLAKSLFPLGEYTKRQVRQLAGKLGLSTAEKKDSQGICFLGQIRVGDFLKEKIKTKVGRIKTTRGEIIGKHQGVWFYTIGQRLRGAEFNIKNSSFQGKDMPGLYVVAKNMNKNELIVGRADDKRLFSKELLARNVHWIAEAPRWGSKIECQIRYGQAAQECKLIKTEYTQPRGSSSILRVRFREKQRAVAPGQSVVFYKGEELLGGGVIVRGLEG